MKRQRGHTGRDSGGHMEEGKQRDSGSPLWKVQGPEQLRQPSEKLPRWLCFRPTDAKLACSEGRVLPPPRAPKPSLWPHQPHHEGPHQASGAPGL